MSFCNVQPPQNNKIVGNPTGEIMVNGGFEAGATGWSDANWQLNITTQYAHGGTHSYRLYTSPIVTQTFPASVPVNSMVSFTFWAGFLGGGNDVDAKISITYDDTTKTDISLNGIGTSFVQIDIKAALTAGKKAVNVILTPGTTNPCYLDDFSLQAPKAIARNTILLTYPPQS